ncbi:hypothetical protein QMK19_10775 [Streptomyces sp. H10-C2]|uniref:hypothetical protein n=1 Tax=unclassified Streptomyces TaxID=2593676 RepID=UPI0024BB3785|nr:MULTISPECIES: hypothetical protein [unclassified Streptomyces]MDJ0340493.1 hypothetical protein [Streptomyces sp. PH10-H1]MDJ0370141.1 hypothetical protein [Streptomyces sp. H10-C2]
MSGKPPPVVLPPRGTVVRDLATGRIGTLRAVMDPGDPYGNHPEHCTGCLADLLPLGGGREWTTEPDQVITLTHD